MPAVALGQPGMLPNAWLPGPSEQGTMAAQSPNGRRACLPATTMPATTGCRPGTLASRWWTLPLARCLAPVRRSGGCARRASTTSSPIAAPPGSWCAALRGVWGGLVCVSAELRPDLGFGGRRGCRAHAGASSRDALADSLHHPCHALQMFYKKARVEYHPVGVVGAIVPWNYPFHNVLNPLTAAVFAGNAVVIKVGVGGWGAGALLCAELVGGRFQLCPGCCSDPGSAVGHADRRILLPLLPSPLRPPSLPSYPFFSPPTFHPPTPNRCPSMQRGRAWCTSA